MTRMLHGRRSSSSSSLRHLSQKLLDLCSVAMQSLTKNENRNSVLNSSCCYLQLRLQQLQLSVGLGCSVGSSSGSVVGYGRKGK